jgi:hypothetical protein
MRSIKIWSTSSGRQSDLRDSGPPRDSIRCRCRRPDPAVYLVELSVPDPRVSEDREPHLLPDGGVQALELGGEVQPRAGEALVSQPAN